MIDILVRRFVKDYENIGDMKVRTSYGILTSVMGIICNIILFIVKFVIGIFIKSISVMADAFNNLSDAASSVIGLVGIKLAERPADKEHPFGHGRYEYISALILSFLIIEVGFSCIKSSIERIISPKAAYLSLAAEIILIISISIKLWLAYFNKVLGKRIKSSIMLATAADAKGDVLITSATIVSVIIGNFTKFPVDGIVGVAVSLFVILSGINIAKDTIEPLLGEAVDPEICRILEEKVLSYDRIIGMHDLIVHNYGPTHFMATVHAELPSNISFEEAHEVIDKIEREILKELNIFLVIHMDPVEINDERVLNTRKKIEDIVENIESEASIHDFRMINGSDCVNIIFDMVIPYELASKKEELLESVVNEIKKIDEKYNCMITVENSFVKK